MTPIEHVAARVVALVTEHSILVSSELHSGIDLARQLVSGQLSEPDNDEKSRILLVGMEIERRYERLTLLSSMFA